MVVPSIPTSNQQSILNQYSVSQFQKLVLLALEGLFKVGYPPSENVFAYLSIYGHLIFYVCGKQYFMHGEVTPL